MDNLVLIRVAAGLRESLVGAVLQEVRAEAGPRLRLVFHREGQPRTLIVCWAQPGAWVGRPMARWRPAPLAASPFTAHLVRALAGGIVRELVKPLAERRLVLAFADGRSLVLELGARAGVTLLDAQGAPVASTRHRPPQAPYPTSRVDPFSADPETLDRTIDALAREGLDRALALERAFEGLGRRGPELVEREVRATGRSPGTVLAARLADLLAGRLDPVIESEQEPLEGAEQGTLDPATTRLWPWDPVPPLAAARRRTCAGALETASAYHEAVDRIASLRLRSEGLRAVLARELRRVRRAEEAAASDLLSFGDPAGFKHQAEALLAGLHQARRLPEGVAVPDPYDTQGGTIVIPVAPGVGLPRAAEDLYRRHRRARRGRETARARSATLGARRSHLEALEQRWGEGAADPQRLEAMQRELFEAGLAVDFQPARPGRTDRTTERPRLAGVRIYRSSDGWTILVGKTARDNERLTLRLAGAEDFWFHAAAAGAHVVVRNEARAAAPPRGTLLEAASLAAWFSDLRDEGGVDVRWTRCKNVRRARGAAPGTVRLKKFATIRVRPGVPAGVVAVGPGTD